MKYFLFTFFIALTSCGNNDTTPKSSEPVETVQPVIACDTLGIDTPPVKNYKKALRVWLENTSLDWFLEKRQMAWREAKAWYLQETSVDSLPIIKCLSSKKKDVFLYIPHHFYNKERTGSEYFQFFIVNNSNDTLSIPRIDATINNISSSVSYASPNDSSQRWLSFQGTPKFVECGNSYWTMKLPPKTAIKSQIESDFLYLGDTTVSYRLELMLDKQKIVSDGIKITLMKQQLPYLGKGFD